MASWQAHVLDALFRVTIKRQLKNNTATFYKLEWVFHGSLSDLT